MLTTGELDISDNELAKKLEYVNQHMPAICNVMDIPDHQAIIERVPKGSHRYSDRYEDAYRLKLGAPVHGQPRAYFGTHDEMQLKVMSGIMMAAHMASVVPRPALDIAATDANNRGTLYFQSIDDLLAAVDAAAKGVDSPAIIGRATLDVLNRRGQSPSADRSK